MLRGVLLLGLGGMTCGLEGLGSLWGLFPGFRDLGSSHSLKGRFLLSMWGRGGGFLHDHGGQKLGTPHVQCAGSTPE